MRMIIYRKDETAVLKLDGPIQATDCHDLIESEINRLLDEGYREIELDLEKVVYIEEPGIVILDLLMARLQEQQAHLVLTHTPPRIQAALHLQKLDRSEENPLIPA